MKTKKVRIEQARNEYEKITEPAWKEYKKITEQALNKYEKIKEPARNEYLKRLKEIENENWKTNKHPPKANTLTRLVFREGYREVHRDKQEEEYEGKIPLLDLCA